MKTKRWNKEKTFILDEKCESTIKKIIQLGIYNENNAFIFALDFIDDHFDLVIKYKSSRGKK